MTATDHDSSQKFRTNKTDSHCNEDITIVTKDSIVPNIPHTTPSAMMAPPFGSVLALLFAATLPLNTHALPQQPSVQNPGPPTGELDPEQPPAGPINSQQQHNGSPIGSNDTAAKVIAFPAPLESPDGQGRGYSPDVGVSGHTYGCGPNRATWDIAIEQLKARAATNNTCSPGQPPGSLEDGSTYCQSFVNITAPQPEDSAFIAVCGTAQALVSNSPACDGDPSVVAAIAYLRDSMSTQLGQGGRAWVGARYPGFFAVMSTSQDKCIPTKNHYNMRYNPGAS